MDQKEPGGFRRGVPRRVSNLRGPPGLLICPTRSAHGQNVGHRIKGMATRARLLCRESGVYSEALYVG